MRKVAITLAVLYIAGVCATFQDELRAEFARRQAVNVLAFEGRRATARFVAGQPLDRDMIDAVNNAEDARLAAEALLDDENALAGDDGASSSEEGAAIAQFLHSSGATDAVIAPIANGEPGDLSSSTEGLADSVVALFEGNVVRDEEHVQAEPEVYPEPSAPAPKSESSDENAEGVALFLSEILSSRHRDDAEETGELSDELIVPECIGEVFEEEAPFIDMSEADEVEPIVANAGIHNHVDEPIQSEESASWSSAAAESNEILDPIQNDNVVGQPEEAVEEHVVEIDDTNAEPNEPTQDTVVQDVQAIAEIAVEVEAVHVVEADAVELPEDLAEIGFAFDGIFDGFEVHVDDNDQALPDVEPETVDSAESAADAIEATVEEVEEQIDAEPAQVENVAVEHVVEQNADAVIEAENITVEGAEAIHNNADAVHVENVIEAAEEPIVGENASAENSGEMVGEESSDEAINGEVADEVLHEEVADEVVNEDGANSITLPENAVVAAVEEPVANDAIVGVDRLALASGTMQNALEAVNAQIVGAILIAEDEIVRSDASDESTGHEDHADNVIDAEDSDEVLDQFVFFAEEQVTSGAIIVEDSASVAPETVTNVSEVVNAGLADTPTIIAAEEHVSHEDIDESASHEDATEIVNVEYADNAIDAEDSDDILNQFAFFAFGDGIVAEEPAADAANSVEEEVANSQHAGPESAAVNDDASLTTTEITEIVQNIEGSAEPELPALVEAPVENAGAIEGENSAVVEVSEIEQPVLVPASHDQVVETVEQPAIPREMSAEEPSTVMDEGDHLNSIEDVEPVQEAPEALADFLMEDAPLGNEQIIDEVQSELPIEGAGVNQPAEDIVEQNQENENPIEPNQDHGNPENNEEPTVEEENIEDNTQEPPNPTGETSGDASQSAASSAPSASRSQSRTPTPRPEPTPQRRQASPRLRETARRSSPVIVVTKKRAPAAKTEDKTNKKEPATTSRQQESSAASLRSPALAFFVPIVIFFML